MLNEESPRRLVQGLTGAIKGLRLYPLEHPALRRQIETLVDAVSELIRGRDLIRIGNLEGTLFVEDYLFVEDCPGTDDLLQILQRLELDGMELLYGIDEKELAALVKILNEQSSGQAAFEQAIKSHGIKHIRPVRNQDEDNDEETPRAVYNRALDVVDRIFNDVRMGEIPASDEVDKTVKSMVQVTLTEPHAMFAMSMLKDYDNYTFTHSVNVAVLALTVGRACNLSEAQLRQIGIGALLHDIGKLEVDWDIINKPGSLTDEEFEQVKKHPQLGATIVGQMEGIESVIVDIVLAHHVRHNRQGYPVAAQAKSLSPLVDMTAIADTYDAMTTLRSYQRPMTPRGATNRLREISGTMLNPEYVENFIRFLGPYPVGSLVRLDSNEIGLVSWVGATKKRELTLKILFDASGRLLAKPHDINLVEDEIRRIIAEVDPFLKGIKVTDYL
ncbi:MAG: hypothetical protein C0616_05305 [Desulfuromonas sp.]|nr:MAG: hypothetical protein C0616_05305 [Desulfuromonas sp.]